MLLIILLMLLKLLH